MTSHGRNEDLTFQTAASEPGRQPCWPSGFRTQAVRLSLTLACLSVPLAVQAQNLATLRTPDLARGLATDAGTLTALATQPAPGRPARRANFGQEAASPASQEIAHWVVDSGDNRNLPFLIVDKAAARVFAFDPQGQLRGAAAVLLGLAVGDDSVPGIGERKLSSIRPEERTTPAGRFVASLDRNLHGEEILWVDYDTSISLHRVVTSQPRERRAQRLATPSPLDNRISYGCINVPVKFYDEVVSPAFTGTDGIVYVLPETRPAREVFGAYDVQARERLHIATQ
ncbi:MAG: hypothetical protein JWR68_2435 [Polaromonas sp.]|nr:hypothetical protein [Polaromonas sp.]